MTIQTDTAELFQRGGTLPLHALYVERPMDEQVRRATLSGEYCNILAARQTGKSSLMVRTMYHLRKEGIRAVEIDLSLMGTHLSATEWYFGFVSSLKQKLGLSIDERAWWNEHAQQGVAQRFSNFLRDVILEEISDPIVIFCDEIDATLSLPFTDDFFTVIRAAYNARAFDPVYKRLTFVLLGVARPADLIKDRNRTPYNIGLSIDLRDFTAQEASKLLPGLKSVPAPQAEAILRRVLHWTEGHPYLTQRTCVEITDSQSTHWSDEQIDAQVRRLFLVDGIQTESNLHYINKRIQESADRAKLVQTYHQILTDKFVVDEELNPIKSQLKLVGLVKVTPTGHLVVRNRIYATVFNPQWIRASLPRAMAIQVWLKEVIGKFLNGGQLHILTL